MSTEQHKDMSEDVTVNKEDGTLDGNGASDLDTYFKAQTCAQNLSVLQKINFRNHRVLEYGFGRGEAMKYALEYGASHYEGVDFTESAHELATHLLKSNHLSLPVLHQQDALGFTLAMSQKNQEKFDIVLMFNFIEYVEREQLAQILRALRLVLHENSILVINTSIFQYDNDGFIQGHDTQNQNPVEKLAKTSEVYCNRYTLVSLHKFLFSCGFFGISEAHFFRPRDSKHSGSPARSFKSLWELSREEGCPLATYSDDIVEYAYSRKYIPEPYVFTKGRMEGLTLYLCDSYLPGFSGGTHDEEMFRYLEIVKEPLEVIFDVGGFMGISSLLFARLLGKEGKICCFEPNPWNRLRIQKNLSYNPEEDKKINIYPFALGNENKKIQFILSHDIDNGYSSTSRVLSSHIAYSWNHLEELGFTLCEVEMIKLDDFVKDSQIIPDLIKIDVEGSEHFFLLGAFETLQKHSPHLLIEFHSPYCAMKCTTFLDCLGYSINVLHEEDDNRLIVSCSRISEKSFSSEMATNFSDHVRYEELQMKLGHTERELISQKEHLLGVQTDLGRTQAELSQTQAELAEAHRILDHPAIRLQRKLWRSLKFWK